jgi:hypothetical protein
VCRSSCDDVGINTHVEWGLDSEISLVVDGFALSNGSLPSVGRLLGIVGLVIRLFCALDSRHFLLVIVEPHIESPLRLGEIHGRAAGVRMSAAVSAGAVIVGCGLTRGGSCYWRIVLTGSPLLGQESSAVRCRGLFGKRKA